MKLARRDKDEERPWGSSLPRRFAQPVSQLPRLAISSFRIDVRSLGRRCVARWALQIAARARPRGLAFLMIAFVLLLSDALSPSKTSELTSYIICLNLDDQTMVRGRRRP